MTISIVVALLVLCTFNAWLYIYNVNRRLFMSLSDEPNQTADHQTPRDLLELHEVLEWQAAVEAAEREAQ